MYKERYKVDSLIRFKPKVPTRRRKLPTRKRKLINRKVGTFLFISFLYRIPLKTLLRKTKLYYIHR